MAAIFLVTLFVACGKSPKTLGPVPLEEHPDASAKLELRWKMGELTYKIEVDPAPRPDMMGLYTDRGAYFRVELLDAARKTLKKFYVDFSNDAVSGGVFSAEGTITCSPESFDMAQGFTVTPMRLTWERQETDVAGEEFQP